MMIQVENIIARIDELCDFNGWTRYRLHKEAGVSPSTMNNVYNRKSFPSIPILKSLCDAFGISLAEFFLFDENPLRDYSIEEDEQRIIYKYRNMSETGKKILLAYIQGVADVEKTDKMDSR
ncbi:MAG: helix-turn-helix transcriptional regulator [Eubacterium sp.]|nr:helix-turn-helix transcriptional regulator [Eubacterium sp.]